MRTLPSGTVTLLFTDIEGSTRLLQELGRDRYVEALERHRELLRQAFTRHGGVEVELQGDSFHVAFPFARDALAAAAEAQRALAANSWAAEPIRVRIGLHSGEPVQSGSLYAGLDVHRAARIMSAGHGGQVLVSQTTRDLVRDELPARTSLRDLGEQRLKDLTEPERLYQLVLEGLRSDFPAPKTLENRRHNLPLQPTPLVGRERELEDTLALIRRDDVRLLTLTGPGGTGKTRLALQIAAELVDDFPDGVFFVNLAALTEPELVLPTVAQTLAVREQPGEPVVEPLVREIAERELLLVLDNFEQVLEAAPELAKVVRAATNVKVVATSRAPLHLAGEREFAVSPLAEPEAVSLFVERARAAKATFALDGNRPVVVEICRRLDNLPLAIELAAARIKLLPEKALLERLDRCLSVLTGGPRDAPARQQTLRAAVDWSYELLSELEQALFARLAVFRGGRTLEAIQAVCVPDVDELDVLDALGSLVDNSLLQQREGRAGEPRFVMLETIHQYARVRLEERPEAEAVQRRHAQYFLRLVEETEAVLRGSHAPSLLDSLQAEQDNLRVAIADANRRGDEELELRLLAAGWQLWWLRGPLSEALRLVEDALSRGSTASAARARALDGASVLAQSSGDFEAARAFAEQGLRVSHAAGDEWAAARATANLAVATGGAGDVERAISLGEEAVQLARPLGDSWALGMALNNLGSFLMTADAHARASAALKEGLRYLRKAGNKMGIAYCILNLGFIALREGRVAEAGETLEEALQDGRELGNAVIVTYALEALATLAASSDDYETSALLLGLAESQAQAEGLRLQPAEQEAHDATMATVRERLGCDRFEATFRNGNQIDLDQAIDAVAELRARATLVEAPAKPG